MTIASRAAFIEADVELLASDQGGRRSPIASGYRCNCWLGKVDHGQRVYNDATFHIMDEERLEPGAVGRVRVQPHDPDAWSGLAPGSTFEMCEGPRLIGTATVRGLFPA